MVQDDTSRVQHGLIFIRVREMRDFSPQWKNSQKRELKERFIGEHVFVTVASCVLIISEQSPLLSSFIPLLVATRGTAQQCCRFRKCSVAIHEVFQRVYARVQRELGRASASLDIKRRLDAVFLIAPPHRAYLFACFLLFVRLPLARCLPSVSRLPIYTSSIPLLEFIPSPALSRWNFSPIFVQREKILSSI